MTTETVFLGIIALATLTMAVIQVAVLVYAAKAVREAGKAVQSMQKTIEPIIASARQVSDDAAKITSLAAKQVERVDSLVDGAMTALKAAVALVNFGKDGKRKSRDDDDGLFIG